jgi:predicted transcriptional regulator
MRIPDLLRALSRNRLAPTLGSLERRVLDALWRRRRFATVREVSRDFPDSAYTTLMTTLDRLFRKGLLERERAGRAYLYRPLFARRELEARLAAEALSALVEGDPRSLKPALSFFVDAVGRHDERLLKELEALVRERRRRDDGKEGR